MNKYNIYVKDEVNGEWFELDIDNQDFTTVFSIADFTDITRRKDNITKDIKIIGTNKNNIMLGRLYDISRISTPSNQSLGFNFQANKYIECQLFENNIQLITGKLLVKDVVVKDGIITYNAVIVGNVISFFNDINDRELKDLDSMNDVVTWSLASAMDSWYTSYSTQKFVFPSIDYGVDERTGNFNTWDSSFDIKNFKPAIRLRYIIESIFRGWRYDNTNDKYTQFDGVNKLNKYSISSPFLADFENIIVPSTDESLVKKVNKKVVFNYQNQSVSSVGILKGCFLLSNGGDNQQYYTTPFSPNFTYLSINGTTKYTGNNITKMINTLDKGIKTSVRIQARIGMSQNVSGTWKLGLCDISQAQEISANNMKWSTTFTKSVTSASTEILIDYAVTDTVDITGTYILAYVRDDQSANYTSASTINFYDVVITFGNENIISTYPLYLYDKLPLFTSLPEEIKITDFLKSIMLMFNLYLFQNPDNPTAFIMDTYNNYYKNIIQNDFKNAVDWSNKLDSNNYKLLTNIDLPSSYVYKYSDDDDMPSKYYFEKYGKQYGEKIVNNSNGIADKQEIEVLFAPTINVSTSLDIKSMPYICQSDSFFMGNKKTYKPKIRLLYWYGRKTGINSYILHYRGGEIQTTGAYGYCSSIKLDSQNNIVSTLFFGLPNEFFTNEIVTSSAYTLFDKYYNQQLVDINNPNMVIMEGDIFLNENDINNLDFTIPIYIENQYGGAYWKLLELEYKKSNTASKIRLQKIV